MQWPKHIHWTLPAMDTYKKKKRGIPKRQMKVVTRGPKGYISCTCAQRAKYRAPEYNVPTFWQIGQGGHLVFPICPKNTNFVEDFEIFLPVKFRCRPFSGFRGDVENVSANQRPGRPSCFSDRPEKKNLVEDVEILLPVKFCWIPFSGFRGEVENVSANQRPGWPSLFFRSARKTLTW